MPYLLRCPLQLWAHQSFGTRMPCSVRWPSSGCCPLGRLQSQGTGGQSVCSTSLYLPAQPKLLSTITAQMYFWRLLVTKIRSLLLSNAILHTFVTFHRKPTLASRCPVFENAERQLQDWQVMYSQRPTILDRREGQNFCTDTRKPPRNSRYLLVYISERRLRAEIK